MKKPSPFPGLVSTLHTIDKRCKFEGRRAGNNAQTAQLHELCNLCGNCELFNGTPPSLCGRQVAGPCSLPVVVVPV